MMNSNSVTEYVFIFNSIHRVMKAERILKKEGVEFSLMPVPRQLSSDCGLSIRYIGSGYDAVKNLLVEAFDDKVSAYKRIDDGYENIL